MSKHRTDFAAGCIVLAVITGVLFLAGMRTPDAHATGTPPALSTAEGPAGMTTTPAQPCNQLLNPDPHTAYICITADAFNKYGADYWMDTAYTRLQTIHPADGLLVVTDAYYCRPNGVSLGSGHVGSVDSGSTATESWCERGDPGVPLGEQEWQARVISVYDGHGACVVYHWKVTDSQVSPPNPTTCFDIYTGKLRPMTALEVKSVVYGWHAMADEPGAW